MGIIAAGQITVVDLSDAPVLNAFITASRPTTQTYSKDSKNYNPSYASTPQVLTLNVTKSGSTTSIIDSISGLHWFVVDGPVKTEITSKVNTSNEYISGNYNEILTTKLNIDIDKGYRHYEATGVWHDPSTDLDVQFSANINLLLTQNGATGPQGPQGDKGDTGATGNGIANTVVTYGLSMTDTTEPATWSSERPALVKGMYLWTRTVIIYTNGESTTSYQISYIPKDGDATGEIDKTKQELLEKLETVRDDSLTAVEEAKQQLVTVRDESLAAAEEAKQQVTTVANDLSKAKTDFQNAVNAVDTKATNVQNDLSQAKQDLASQAQQLQEQANAQSELTNRVSSVEETTNGTKTTVSELSKTVDQNGKNITSVTARTKVVEDDLAGTKTTLSQVKMTADSTSQKTATLETGLDGLSAKFENLKVGSRNYFKDSKSRKYYINNTGTQDVRTFIDDDFWKNDTRFTKDYVRMSFDIAFNPALPSDFTTNVHFSASPWYSCGGITFKGGTTALQHFDLKFNLSGAGDSYKTDNIFIRLNNTLPLNTAVSLENFNLYLSAVVEDYSSNEADIEQKVAEYKQNADQNYASLQTTVQNLDGTVQHNKTVADQTAQGFTTRIESLETYKDGESTRANKYFELAKTETARQLSVERTAIAKDYVAKSTYTSDVTGIRNELSATTTTTNTIKTNLANYQASNDRAVASLQSNIQTANGDISSLKTKVEAVPGQITSAVSAVESKIPTEIGSSNLLRNTAVNADNLRLFEKSNSTISVVTKDGHQTYKIVVSATNNSGVNFKGNALYYNLSKNRTYTFSFWVLTNKDKSYGFNSLGHIQVVNENGDIVGSDMVHQHSNPIYSTNTVKANTWTKVWCTFKATSNSYFRPFFWYLTAGDEIYIYDMMLNEGNIPLSYTPAFEDTQSKITSLNTALTQTADGLRQLSTQVTTQGNTITSHTNSINSLTTGLQAKVSQSDFNKLSGRVTTAENNITAKANELSSKITSVEGKIPTNVSTRNLILKSNDFANPHKQNGANTTVTSTDDYFVIRSTSYTSNSWGGISWNMSISEVKAGEEFSILMPVYIDSSVSMDNGWAFTLKNHPSNSAAYSYDIPTNKKDQWFNVAITFKSLRDVKFDTYPFFVYIVKNGLVRIKPPMLVRGNLIPSDYQPAFEDNIPTSVDTINLVKGTGSSFVMGYGITNTTWNETKKQAILDFSTPGVNLARSSEILPQGNAFPNFKPIKGMTYTQSIMIDTDATFAPNGQATCSWFTSKGHNEQKAYIKKVGEHSYRVWSTCTWQLEDIALRVFDWFGLHNVLLFRTSGTYLAFYKPKLTTGNLPSDWSPSPEDYDDAITRVSSEIKQTADGLTQLSTKVTSQGSTITSHTNSINSLTTGLNAKVSQSDFNTLSGRVTTAENNITAKANELSSKITSVEGKLPSGEINLVEYGRPADGYSPYRGAEYTTHGFYYNGAYKMYIIRNTATNEKLFGMNRFKVERNTEYTLYFKGFNNGSITNMDVWFLKRVNGSKNEWDSAQQLVAGRKFSVSRAEDVSVTFNTGNYDEGYLRFDNNGTRTSGTSADLYFGDVSVKKGKSNNGWSPSLAELASSQALKNAQSEFKQTTDSIKASVQSLDNNTVKNSSLTINADGIVMKAGKSTTDVANAIGSYFAVNQNAINLFSDKIKVKGNMIVDGTINVSKISGLDANFIKSKIEYAMIDWLKGKSITAYNGNMTIDLQNGRISFKDGTNAIYRQTSDGIHTGFLHFEAGSLGGIYAAFGATSTRQGINSKSSEFAGIRCYRVSKSGDSHDAKIDKIEVIGDTVQFGHGYRSDGSIGGGFIMDTAAFANETPYSFNRVIKSIESLWRILYDHARNTGYRFNDSAFINALSNEYRAWHDMRNQ